ncbi:hypothetical protein [Limnohabitans sp. INBF002]|uniref:hypothetical protein n=1 Tax=Limnohabitans sp. INBF002 TaxID=2986280 RepID=UPI002491657A|nr:hypothetical protein [Limnohabitans sp. INBF002]
MSEDPRCCGTGTCIINADGMCWCGQRWDGEKMCFPKLDAPSVEKANASQAPDVSSDHSP